MGSFCPEASKRRKLEVEVAEDGVMELCVEYNRCVPCGRRGRVWGGTHGQRKERYAFIGAQGECYGEEGVLWYGRRGLGLSPLTD